MGLCGHANDCNCAIVGNGISVAGSGRAGDPYIITPLGTYVCTSATRPTPILGLAIYETDTLRELRYDGTNWVIIGGRWPGCSASWTGTTSIATNTPTTVTLSTEEYDYGGFHASTNGYFTVPAGLAGEYTLIANTRWGGSGTGSRVTLLIIGSNGAVVNPAVSDRAASFPSEATTNNWTPYVGSLRLLAGAVVTLQGYQTSGGALNLTGAALLMKMTEHIPALS